MDEAEITATLREAVASFQSGDLARAEELYRALVAAAPDVRKWSDLGVVLKARGRLDEAVHAYRRAIELGPEQFTPRYNLANLLRDRGDTVGAIASYGRAIALNPDFADARINLGLLLLQQDRIEEALPHFSRAVEGSPRSHHAHNNLGIALRRAGRVEEAIASLRRAIELKADYTEAHSNLGSAYLALNRLDEAIAHCRKAIEINPAFADGHYNLASCYWNALRPEEAIVCYERALALVPANADYRWNHALVLLLTGQFARGWAEYESRWLLKDATPKRYEWKPWAGEIRPGARLLLWREQGLGDEIIYASMVPELLQAGLRVTLEVDPRLASLMQRSFPGARVVAKQDPPAMEPADFDWQCPLDGAGRWLRLSFASFPLHAGYLRADAARGKAFADRLRGPGVSRVIGISWHSTNPNVGAAKSMSLADWVEILRVPGTRFVDLQYGNTGADRAAAGRAGLEVTHLDDLDLDSDIDGLAALCAACDLVITTSNVTAHVAGALGKPVWLLAPGGRGRIWYWFHGRNDSPWYPSMRIYSQARPGSWREPVADVARDLTRLVERG
jgi:tetratricopeptide (TPR) repeat protein